MVPVRVILLLTDTPFNIPFSAALIVMNSLSFHFVFVFLVRKCLCFFIFEGHICIYRIVGWQLFSLKTLHFIYLLASLEKLVLSLIFAL